MPYKGVIGQYKHETETGNALRWYICPHEHETESRNALQRYMGAREHETEAGNAHTDMKQNVQMLYI